MSKFLNNQETKGKKLEKRSSFNYYLFRPKKKILNTRLNFVAKCENLTFQKHIEQVKPCQDKEIEIKIKKERATDHSNNNGKSFQIQPLLNLKASHSLKNKKPYKLNTPFREKKSHIQSCLVSVQQVFVSVIGTTKQIMSERHAVIERIKSQKDLQGGGCEGGGEKAFHCSCWQSNPCKRALAVVLLKKKKCQQTIQAAEVGQKTSILNRQQTNYKMC